VGRKKEETEKTKREERKQGKRAEKQRKNIYTKQNSQQGKPSRIAESVNSTAVSKSMAHTTLCISHKTSTQQPNTAAAKWSSCSRCTQRMFVNQTHDLAARK
jgi:hypothetical protein